MSLQLNEHKNPLQLNLLLLQIHFSQPTYFPTRAGDAHLKSFSNMCFMLPAGILPEIPAALLFEVLTVIVLQILKLAECFNTFSPFHFSLFMSKVTLQ